MGQQTTEIAGKAVENCVRARVCVCEGEGLGYRHSIQTPPGKKTHRLLRKPCIGKATTKKSEALSETKQRTFQKHRNGKKNLCEKLSKTTKKQPIKTKMHS